MEDESIDFVCIPSLLTPTVDDLQDDISLLGVPPIVSLQTPVTLSERESYKEMDSLRAECERLILNSENKNIHAAFTMKAIKKNPEKCVMLTGLITQACNGFPL